MKNPKKIIINLFMSLVLILTLSNYTDQNVQAKKTGLDDDELFLKVGEELAKESRINNARNYKESQEYYKTHSKDTVTSPKPYKDLKVSDPNKDVLYTEDKAASKTNNKEKIKSSQKSINKNKKQIKNLKAKNSSSNNTVKSNKINK